MKPEEESRKAIYDKAYAEAKEYRDIYYHADKCQALPLKGRRELEAAITNMVGILAKYGIGLDSKHPPMHGVTDFLITFHNTDSPVFVQHNLGGEYYLSAAARMNFSISNRDTCWHCVISEPTQEEMEMNWKRAAKIEVDYTERKIAEDEARRKKELEDKVEFVKRHGSTPGTGADKVRKELEAQGVFVEPNKRTGVTISSADPTPKPFVVKDPCNEFAEEIRPIVNMKLKCSDGWFAEDHFSNEKIETIKNYVRRCFDFSDAMNEGLSGLGLYTFDTRRREAHEKMEEAFGIEDNRYARHVMKTLDFEDDYDTKLMKYVHNDFNRVIDTMAWAINECIEKEKSENAAD